MSEPQDHPQSADSDPVPGEGLVADASVLGAISRRSATGIEHRSGEVALLQAEIKELKQFAQLCEVTSGFLASGRPGEALRTLRHASKVRQLIAERDATAATGLDTLEQELVGHVDASLPSFSARFVAALEELGTSPDRTSRDPKYTFNNYIEVRVERKRYEAVIATRGGVKTRMGLDPHALAAEVKASISAIFERDSDLPAIASQLATTYQHLRASHPDTAAVPIKEILDELRQKDKNFSLDAFLVDLSRLVLSSAEDTPLATGMRLDHTKQTDEGLLLPGLEERGYFGYLRFETTGGINGDQRPGPADS